MAAKTLGVIFLIFYISSFLQCYTNAAATAENKPPVWRDFLENKLEIDGIYENTPVGTVLGQLDAYDPEGQNIFYECHSQTVQCTRSGVVTLVRKLDREFSIKNPGAGSALLTTKFIAIEVNDQENPSRSEKIITINIKDINDNAPNFLNVPYKTSVAENAAAGTTIFRGVSVEDVDSGFNAQVTLSCFTQHAEDPEACNYFSVLTVRDSNVQEGKYNGIIILNKPLDYEKKSSYVMTILAKDEGAKPLSASVNVLILIDDIQDKPPFFQQSPYTIFVSEATKLNVPVAKLKAQDGDTGNPNPVKIEITYDPKNYFQVGPSLLDSGVIYASNLSLKRPLDRETQGRRYSFNISVTELSNNIPTTAKGFSYVNVEILDENDNAPHFVKNQYTMTIPEYTKMDNTGALIGNPIVAVDEDSGSNAIFSIEITNQTIPGVFGVSPTSGIKATVVSLLALKPSYLDYDNLNYRNQRVVITTRQTNSSVQLSSSTTVFIRLTDENDNPPIFEKSTYLLAIPENTKVGSSILLLQATDKDSGKNQEIVYQISGYGSEYFSVTPNGTVVLKLPLDFEFISNYILLAFARDKGEPSLQSTTDVIITVTDVNDNGPIFNLKSYSTNVFEKSTQLEPDIQVQATDKDMGTRITYAIDSGNTPDNAFEINSTTGVITLKRGLATKDAIGKSGTILLRIKATDNGKPPQSSFVTVNVNILDINDNNPIFNQPVYKKTLKEFTAIGTYVLTVNATDDDSGVNAELEYFIGSGNYDDFRIESKTGKIYVSSRANLDYDIRKQYNIVVLAEDLGTPRLSGSATVIIDLIDTNNKKPVFDKSEYYVTIDEKTVPNTSILKVSATDQDADNELEYSIDKRSFRAQKADGGVLPSSTFDFRNAFAINSKTGEIKTTVPFTKNLNPTISFDVLVKDLNADKLTDQIAQAGVVVIIHASKRKMPYFIPEDPGQTKKIYRFTLPEDKQEGVRITRLQAIDPITGTMVTKYRLISNSLIHAYFNITNEGYVYLNKKLDYESMTTNPLNFDILAIADQSRTSTAGMEITVIDVNDNSPIFDQKAYTFNISELLRFPSTVGFVKASDQDSGSYSQISYSIEGLGHTDFWMQQDGEIFVNKNTQLDYEKRKVYLLQVTATDNPRGDTHRKTLVDLTINVMDVNDNKPTFIPSNYTFYMTETNDIGDSVGSVTAKDSDSGSNSRILYSLQLVYSENGAPIFTIDRNTGKLRVGTELAAVAQKSPISFKVFATDQGIPPLAGEGFVTVLISTSNVQDIPKIIRPLPSENITIPEDKPINSKIFTVIAKARENSSIIYTIDEPKDAEIRQYFHLNNLTGDITLIKPLDFEKDQFYFVLLKVTDKFNSTLYRTQRLKILVLDVDDNLPSFRSCNTFNQIVSTSVPENYPVNSYVIKVAACDKDSAPFNKMHYEWANEAGCANAAGDFTAFNLSSQTGLITTAKVLDYEEIKEYLLCVRVQPLRNLTVRYNDEVQQVLVKVRDTNDNGPIFPNKNIFAVINEKTILGSEVVMVTSNDADGFPYNQEKYSIVNIVYHSSKDGKTYSTPNAFTVVENTGVIKTNLQSYTDFVRDYFVVNLRAEDKFNPLFFNKVDVKIYVIQPRQRSRIVLPKPPKDNTQTVNDLLKKLNELKSGEFRSQEMYYHQGQNGVETYEKTDVCLIIENDGHVLTLGENQKLLESNKMEEVLKQFDAELAGSCNPETSVDYTAWSVLWWVLVVFAIFIFICAVILIVVISLLYKSHKKFMESERTSLIQN